MFSFSCVLATFFDFIFCFFLCPGMTRMSVLMWTVTETMKRPDVSERNLPSSRSTSPFCPKLCWRDKNQCQTDIELLSSDLCWAWAGALWWNGECGCEIKSISPNLDYLQIWGTGTLLVQLATPYASSRIRGSSKKPQRQDNGEGSYYLAPRGKSYSVSLFHLPVVPEVAAEGRAIWPS